MAELYDSIGKGYDQTRKGDPEILVEAASILAIKDGGKYLDVACGSGNYTVGLSQIGGEWFACDVSQNMLAIAREKSTAISWNLSRVESLSYASAQFDAVYCSLAIHHFVDLGSSFQEIARVLKQAGTFTIFTALPTQMENYWLNHYFPVMMRKACNQMPTFEEIRLALERASMAVISTKKYEISPELQDLFLYSGKHRPELYLSETVRNGISSFHGMCPKPELESGLAALEADIDSHRIHDVMRKYFNEDGDYLFICSQKVG